MHPGYGDIAQRKRHGLKLWEFDFRIKPDSFKLESSTRT